MFEKAGLHIIPNHYYCPIPDTSTLNNELWEKESELVGLDMNINEQLKLLRDVFSQFRGEFNFPTEKKHTFNDFDFYLNNSEFGAYGDAEVLH